MRGNVIILESGFCAEFRNAVKELRIFGFIVQGYSVTFFYVTILQKHKKETGPES